MTYRDLSVPGLRFFALLALLAGPALVSGAAVGKSTAARDVVLVASSIPKAGLSEWRFLPDPAAAGGQLAETPNSGGDLDPPPESDPHVTTKIKVEGGVPYRVWVRMKVGTPKGVSKANKLWVQFSKVTDAAGKEILKPETGSYLTAQGPTAPGWAWVPCELGAEKSTKIKFKGSGEVTVYIQAGMEGVGFDQLVLSPARFLDSAPTDAVVSSK